MSERRIIKFEQFAPNCKHRMGGCGMKMGSTKQTPCSFENCPIFEQLPDAEPILEAARRMRMSLRTTGHGTEFDEITSALKAAGIEL